MRLAAIKRKRNASIMKKSTAKKNACAEVKRLPREEEFHELLWELLSAKPRKLIIAFT
ncbi:hypothetical protein D3C87_1270630 [compost metagenome]